MGLVLILQNCAGDGISKFHLKISSRKWNMAVDPKVNRPAQTEKSCDVGHDIVHDKWIPVADGRTRYPSNQGFHQPNILLKL
jgi:hypothetical protein